VCSNGDMSASSLLLVLKKDLDLITSFPEALEFESKTMSLSLSDSALPSNCFFDWVWKASVGGSFLSHFFSGQLIFRCYVQFRRSSRRCNV